MPEYRKKKGSDTWHWCTNCRDWPTGTAGVDYEVSQTKPSTGELDNECRSKDARGECRTK